MEREMPDKNDGVCETTSSLLGDLVSSFAEYKDLLNAFSDGKTDVELRKRYMLKQIDEAWVKAIEDALPSIDRIIRNPENALAEREEVMPTELTRKVTGRSVVYLSQHTDMINEIKPDGTVVPSKLLNVFQEDTILTYENKFINTLLVRIYTFVSKRSEMAEERGEDEKNTRLSLTQSFEKGSVKGKITLGIETSEPIEENEEIKNYFYSSKLWKRVLNLRKITSDYMSSSFAVKMGRNYVRPPVVKTNKLLKNVEMRNCLTLWEFLDSYENVGYETLISEKYENLSDKCISDFSASLCPQYVLFDRYIRGSKEETLAERDLRMIKPRVKDTLDEFDESEFDYKEKMPEYGVKPESGSEEDDEIVYAIEVALATDKALRKEASGETGDEKVRYAYRYSFESKLILTQNPNQRYYGEIKNELLSYKGVKARMSFRHEAFCFSKKLCALMKFRGKTLYLRLPVNADDFDKKYRLVSVTSDKKRLADMKIKSDRSVKYAVELISFLLHGENAERAEDFIRVNYDKPFEPMSQLLQSGLVKYANNQ